MNATTKPAPRVVAIYCRKSSEEGLDREFNSLDAQRQSCEQFAASQRHEGWTVSPEHYDDGGFSGGNTERPALQRLLTDIDLGKVHVVAVYKLDRMSRSLTDFVGLLQRLDAKQVAFVSVTQHFNTATPMGRLMLNILICFAQFERENTIERIRDKVAATKRMGRWCGGMPPLGYDVASGGRRLVVNEAEAQTVRAIFQAYLTNGTMQATLADLARRGVRMKHWTNRNGILRGGGPFKLTALARLLRDVLVTGQVRYRGELYAGEHMAIVDQDLFDAVQQHIDEQRRHCGREKRTKHFALLRGLLACGPCNCGMTYTYTKTACRFYSYYTCAASRATKSTLCPTAGFPAHELERLVIAELAAICRDKALIDQVLHQAGAEHDTRLAYLKSCLQEAQESASRARTASARQPKSDSRVITLRRVELDLIAAQRAVELLERSDPRSSHARIALESFDPVWQRLEQQEQQKLLRSLIERITVDGHAGKIAIAFKSDGIARLNSEPGAA